MTSFGGLCPDCDHHSVVLEVWASEGGRNKCLHEDCGWWEPAVTKESDE